MASTSGLVSAPLGSLERGEPQHTCAHGFHSGHPQRAGWAEDVDRRGAAAVFPDMVAVSQLGLDGLGTLGVQEGNAAVGQAVDGDLHRGAV